MGSDLHIAMTNVGYSVTHAATACGIDLGYDVFRWDRDVKWKDESPSYLRGRNGNFCSTEAAEQYPATYG